MIIGNFIFLLAEHERHFVFGITIGYLEEIPAYGLVINLGAGGIIIGYKKQQPTTPEKESV